MSWPPGDDDAGRNDVSFEEMQVVWKRWDLASDTALCKSADLEEIRQLKLPHGATLSQTKWLSPRVAVAYANAWFDSDRTGVTYLVVFEKKWFRWKLRTYYTAIVACGGLLEEEPNQPSEPTSGLTPGRGSL